MEVLDDKKGSSKMLAYLHYMAVLSIVRKNLVFHPQNCLSHLICTKQVNRNTGTLLMPANFVIPCCKLHCLGIQLICLEIKKQQK